MKQTKANLMRIAEIFDQNMPVSWKKERMARRAEEILMANPDRLMMLMSREAVHFMRTTLEAHPDGWADLFAVGEWRILEIADYVGICGKFGLTGLTHDGQSRLGFQMTEEWMELLRSGAGWDEGRAKRLDSVMRCYTGIVRTYGAMPMEAAHGTLCRCFPKEDAALLRWLITWRKSEFDLYFVDVEEESEYEHWVSCFPPQEQFGALYEEMLPIMKITPYRAFTRKQYEFAAEHGWPVYPDGYTEVLAILMRMGMAREQAVQSLDEAVSIRQQEIKMDDDALKGILQSQEWHDSVGLPQLQMLLEALTAMINVVPMWIFKGNSSMDMRRMALNRGAKILPFANRK